MDRAYTVNNVQRRDEWESKYSNGGNDMVDYAIALDGEAGWIKLSQKITTAAPEVGKELFGHIENKTNANGTEYRKFVKVNQQRPGGNPGVPSERVEYIVMMLEELTGRRKVEDLVVEPTAAELEDPFAGLGI